MGSAVLSPPCSLETQGKELAPPSRLPAAPLSPAQSREGPHEAGEATDTLCLSFLSVPTAGWDARTAVVTCQRAPRSLAAPALALAFWPRGMA